MKLVRDKAHKDNWKLNLAPPKKAQYDFEPITQKALKPKQWFFIQLRYNSDDNNFVLSSMFKISRNTKPEIHTSQALPRDLSEATFQINCDPDKSQRPFLGQIYK